MLLGGACANDTPAWGGALSFTVPDSPSNAWWALGSAKKFMLIAGACADIAPSICGALPFAVSVPPSWTSWNAGSANIKTNL